MLKAISFSQIKEKPLNITESLVKFSNFKFNLTTTSKLNKIRPNSLWLSNSLANGNSVLALDSTQKSTLFFFVRGRGGTEMFTTLSEIEFRCELSQHFGRSLSGSSLDFAFTTAEGFQSKPCLAATYVNGHLKKFNTLCSGT